MEGYLKQEKLREKVEQMQDARAKAERYVSEREAKSDGSSASDPAHPPPWEAPPPPMGVHAMAEAQIERAMRAGVECSASRVVRTTSAPSLFTAPAGISSPTRFETGSASPVMCWMETSALPCVTMPSKGTCLG